jgi:hypothetical protein
LTTRTGRDYPDEVIPMCKKVTLSQLEHCRRIAAAIDPATRYLPDLVLADWLDERELDGSPLRLPIQKYKFTCTGDFHHGSHTVVADVVSETKKEITIWVSRRQIDRVNRKLCGIRECCCGDRFHVPGVVEPVYTDDSDSEADGFEFTITKGRHQ